LNDLENHSETSPSIQLPMHWPIPIPPQPPQFFTQLPANAVNAILLPLKIMENLTDTNRLVTKQAPNDHLANERTMLAWVRTGIGIIAFGFAVVKFSLFVRQLSVMVGKQAATPQGYSAEIGMSLVALGTLSILFAYLRYQKTRKQLIAGNYQHSPLLLQLLTGMMFLIGIALMAYLIVSQ
jgi:putative membrane protein